MTDDARLARIRERAYQLWRDDACPEGQAEEYWQRARAAVILERMAHGGASVRPAARTTDGVDKRAPEMRAP